MKKFKVIEESRFLDKKKMNLTLGGLTCKPEYNVKPCRIHLTCGQKPAASAEFSNCNETEVASCQGWFDIKHEFNHIG